MEKSGALRPSEISRKRRHRRRRIETTALGTTVLLLAAVGVVFLFWKIVSATVGYVKDYIGPAETPQFFESYIAPVVMQNPDPFTDAAKLDPDWVVKTGVWAAITSDVNNGKYAYTDDSREIVPAADIKKQIVNLFGEDYKPHFRTFTDPNTSATYEYNKKDDCFYIPMIAYSDYFTPSIRTKPVNKNGTVKLIVGYISGQGWAQNDSGTVTPPPASKTMLYVLKGSRGRYRIVSVQDYSTASSSAASSEIDPFANESIPLEDSSATSGSASSVPDSSDAGSASSEADVSSTSSKS